MTVYLSPEQVLFIHARVIHETGGKPGIRDLSMLRSAVQQPRALLKGKEEFPGLYTKAAVLFHQLITGQPFKDGNIGTALGAAGLFLRRNDFQLKVDTPEMVHFAHTCVRNHPSMEYITAWIWQYARPIKSQRKDR
jgi:death on curing protein